MSVEKDLVKQLRDAVELDWLIEAEGTLNDDTLTAAADEIERLRDEIEQMRIDTVPKSWDGLMSILDEVYPADIFDGSSGDPGPVIITHLRAINEIRAPQRAS